MSVTEALKHSGPVKTNSYYLVFTSDISTSISKDSGDLLSLSLAEGRFFPIREQTLRVHNTTEQSDCFKHFINCESFLVNQIKNGKRPDENNVILNIL